MKKRIVYPQPLKEGGRIAVTAPSSGAGCGPVKNFGLQDALHHVFDGLGIPVLYDLDIGHVPPQLTLVNGAFAKVKASAGAGNVTMSFV
ncbi:hypothetical protein ACI48J_20190 [Paenibacillus chitinolyticus]|uniref:hypothetical protein n=1 Tax=Paenibacillus chitinolyticus TaxID=79263 RepID=UPI002DB88DBC|nr:hypothetical protein [Paenibacillus chitinolyticus]MEC0247775.1 hypothetical protein [Paenibacillus chitinolyticus]